MYEQIADSVAHLAVFEDGLGSMRGVSLRHSICFRASIANG
jgi:hypothetical protein